MGEEERFREGGQASARWTLTTDGECAATTLAGELDLAAVTGPTDGILGELRAALAR
jgi:hypothetical protein